MLGTAVATAARRPLGRIMATPTMLLRTNNGMSGVAIPRAASPAGLRRSRPPTRPIASRKPRDAAGGRAATAPSPVIFRALEATPSQRGAT
jgi:hypothetical protein